MNSHQAKLQENLMLLRLLKLMLFLLLRNFRRQSFTILLWLLILRLCLIITDLVAIYRSTLFSLILAYFGVTYTKWCILQKKERALKKKQRQERQQNDLTNFYGAGVARSCRNRGPVNYTFGMVQILFGSLLSMCPESW